MLSKIELFNTAASLFSENGAALYLAEEFCFRVTITLPGRILSLLPIEPGAVSSEPGAVSSEPGAVSSEPGTVLSELGIASSKPETFSSEPGTVSSKSEMVSLFNSVVFVLAGYSAPETE